MRSLLLITAVLVLAGPTAGFARGGMHGHSGGSHFRGAHFAGGHARGGALSTAANPAVPPSLTPDPRLTGTAPLPRITSWPKPTTPPSRQNPIRKTPRSTA
jgi:hypothetical protein